MTLPLQHSRLGQYLQQFSATRNHLHLRFVNPDIDIVIPKIFSKLTRKLFISVRMAYERLFISPRMSASIVAGRFLKDSSQKG
jgi:hypothetical protein